MKVPHHHAWLDAEQLAIALERCVEVGEALDSFQITDVRAHVRDVAAIRDDEAAAEASGVPTLKLKLIATALSGGFMGMAGAPLPYYVTYLDPSSGFSLNYAVNAIAMPLIGGTSSWLGPVVGAVLVGGLQEYLRVTISSAINELVAGVLMVVFVIGAPQGIGGLFQR